MGEKIFIIILKVDLDCRKCYKKISKTICMLQERESIQTVNFDEKKNTVTISGPFDPKMLCKKLCCKASKVIKDIQINEETPKKEEKEQPDPGCSCGCRPWYWYGGYYGDYKCPRCERGYGWAGAEVPAMATGDLWCTTTSDTVLHLHMGGGSTIFM